MIQDIAAEKAKLNARTYIQSIWLNRTEPITENTVLKWFEDIANNGWQDCLNHLAGSEGDAVKHFDFKSVHADELGSEFVITKPVFVEIFKEHTASAVAKAVGEKWVSVETKPKNGTHLVWDEWNE